METNMGTVTGLRVAISAEKNGSMVGQQGMEKKAEATVGIGHWV